jgi:hypothetical protein
VRALVLYFETAQRPGDEGLAMGAGS